jgi:D-methionine transport system permease protein
MFPFIKATIETLYMVLVSGSIAGLCGLSIGLWMYATSSAHLLAQRNVYRFVSVVANIVRSIPFIIFMIILIPVTRLIVGTSIGTHAAIVPLTLAAIPFFARLSESVFAELPSGLLEAGKAMGATPRQILCHMVLPEALPGLIRAMTVMLITLVGYSAMAGIVGGGGLGTLAYNEGYQHFNATVMLITTVILIVLVQAIQSTGDYLAAHYTR